MKAQDFVRATAAYHDELCPAAWSGDAMRGEVRERLIGIAQLFIGFLEVEGFVVEDIVLTGSLANYNWTKFSDFDLHVVTDYANLRCDDLAEAFYRAKKTIWNNQHDITIYGHEVELYVEDINEPPVSGGMFSVLHDEWIKTPDHENPNVNDTAIVRKVIELEDQIERAIKSADDPEDLKRLTDKLRKLRQAGLDAGGEFSVENLAFKTLRNMGIIKALHDAYIEKQDDTMRLNEFAPTRGGGAGGDYLRVLASAWYNDTFNTGSLQKGIKSQEDVERVLARGVVCNDGKTRKYHIDYNSDFDGVVLSTEDYYEHGGEDGVTDTRTGKPFGPYDYIEFSDEQLGESLNEFAPDDGGGSRKFIPWTEFIEQLKQILHKDFECKEGITKSTIKARFVPHDPMEFGPTMLYSYYETRGMGRDKGAVSTRGAIQVGKYSLNRMHGASEDQLITGFHLLKGHPFERHFDLTFDNLYKIANIIKGNREGAYVMQNNNTEA